MKLRIMEILTVAVATLVFVFIILCLLTWARAATPAQRNMDTAHEIAEIMRARGYSEDNPVILACQDWWRAENEGNTATQVFVTEEQKKAYPVAAALWQYLREAGLPEIQAAAALGNAMAESGGHTLDIDLYQYVDGFYGPWAMSTRYFPTVYGKGAKGIVEELMDSLEWNMKDKGGSVDTWMALTDVREAARYFGIYWEAPRFYNAEREANAVAAFEYFGGGAG